MNTAKLSPRARHFAELRARGMSARDAYAAAGYSARGPSGSHGASRLNRDPNVQAYIDQVQREVQDRTVVTIERIVRGLLAEAESVDNSSADRISAWRALASMTPGAIQPKALSVAVSPGSGGSPRDRGLTPELERVILIQILGVDPATLPALQPEVIDVDAVDVVES